MAEEKINLAECPKNEPVKVYSPDGTFICETADELMFNFIRLKISQNRMEGFTIVFRGMEYPINRYGKVDPRPDGLFDKNEQICSDILKNGVETRKAEVVNCHECINDVNGTCAKLRIWTSSARRCKYFDNGKDKEREKTDKI